jgi:hypothetical protein
MHTDDDAFSLEELCENKEIDDMELVNIFRSHLDEIVYTLMQHINVNRQEIINRIDDLEERVWDEIIDKMGD